MDDQYKQQWLYYILNYKNVWKAAGRKTERSVIRGWSWEQWHIQPICQQRRIEKPDRFDERATARAEQRWWYEFVCEAAKFFQAVKDNNDKAVESIHAANSKEGLAYLT
jgi:hypothetical protein